MKTLGYDDIWNIIDNIVETEQDIVVPDFEDGVYSGGKATTEQVVYLQELDHNLHELVYQEV